MASKQSLFTGYKAKPPQTLKPQYKTTDVSKWDPELVKSATEDVSKWEKLNERNMAHLNPNNKRLIKSRSVPTTVASPREASSPYLSPIARFIVDAFRKNGFKWGPQVTTELEKLRRVNPNLVAQVLKVQTDPTLASMFFQWASKQKGFRHDYASFNAYTYCLNRTNQTRALDNIPELMESHGKPPSEHQFTILIRFHAEANRGLRVYHIYEKMTKKFKIKPSVHLYNRVMEALVKTGHLGLALLVYEDFKASGLVEETNAFMILIKGLCKGNRVDEALEILGRMRENLCRPDVFAYTAMVKVMIGEGHLDGAMRVWEEMRRDNVEPDVVAYGTMVAGLCKGSRVEEGFELFKEMRRKEILIDREIYAKLVDSFVSEGKLGLAVDLLRDMSESGYRADLGVYSSLIRGFCGLEKVDKADRLFRAAVREGLGPGFETVNPILLCHAKTKNMTEFRNLLSQMEKLGIPMTEELSKFYTFAVEKERVETGVEVFEGLTKRSRSVEQYNILIEALHKIGSVKKALSLFDDMIAESSNIEPDSKTYSLAIECLVEDGRVREALDCLDKMVKMSRVPSVSAYLTLARGLCDIMEIDKAMMVVRDCLGKVESGPAEFKYTLRILHTCRSRSPAKESQISDNVIEILNEMISEGCPPDNVIYSAIISGMCRFGMVLEGKKVFSNLRDRKILSESKEIMYNEMLLDHASKKADDHILTGIKLFGSEKEFNKAQGFSLRSNKRHK